MLTICRSLFLSALLAGLSAESVPVPPEPIGGNTLVTELPAGAHMSIGTHKITTKAEWATFLNGCSEYMDFAYYESKGQKVPPFMRNDKMVFDATTWTSLKDNGARKKTGTYAVVGVSATYAVVRVEFPLAADGTPSQPGANVFYFIRPDRIVKRYEAGNESVVTMSKP